MALHGEVLETIRKVGRLAGVACTMVLGAFVGAACVQLAIAGERPCTEYAKGAKLGIRNCEDPGDCPPLVLKPSNWGRRHANLYIDAVNAILRDWSVLCDSSNECRSSELGLVLEDESVPVACALSHRIKRFRDLDTARAAYQGVVGRDVLVVRRATAHQTKAGLAVVEFEGYSYLSRVRGGKWELDWQVLDEYVAFRGRDGILHVWRVGGAAT